MQLRSEIETKFGKESICARRSTYQNLYKYSNLVIGAMNTTMLICSTIWVMTLATATAAIAGTSSQMNQASTSVIQQSTNSSQDQTTAIDLDFTRLRTPHILTVSTPAGTAVSGTIVVNGKIIQRLTAQGASLNVSPYLSRGRHTIKILGRYLPAQSSVQVKLSGSGTQVSQQTGGNGELRQTFVINVL